MEQELRQRIHSEWQENEGTETSAQGEEEEEEEEEEEKEVDPRSLLTKEQVQFFKGIFESFDQNNKDRIPSKTIGFALRLIGLNPTKAEIKNHMTEADPLGKGLIDFQSFLLPIAQRINEEAESHEDVIAAFRIFDEEGEGFVYVDRMSEYLTTLGEDLEDFEVELFTKSAETKGTGKIHYVEFVEKMMGVVRKNQKEKKQGKGKKKK